MEEKNLHDLQSELTKLKKTQVRTKYKFNIMLSVIAMLVLIAATLAWFTLSNFASVNQIDLHISTAPGLYLDIENRGTSDLSAWKKTLTNDMINEYLTSVSAPAIADQLLDPVTSSDGIAFTNRTGVTRTANNDSFMEFKVWFIATTDMWVHLSGETVEVVSGTNATTACTTTETGAKADVVNALRVSYEDSSSAAIWEPNKGSAVAGQTTFDVNGANYSNDTRIFHLDAMTPKQITFRIWAEGEDPECDDDIQAANATIEMLFCGTDNDNVPFA